MKPLKPFEFSFAFQKLTAGLAASVILLAGPLVAAPTAQTQPAHTNSLRSSFILPANPTEGHDPFFPKSNRPYEAALASTNSSVEITALVVRGSSGPPDHRLVIINNHTFAAGDVSDVITEQGRIRVHCIEIKHRSVVIEVRGEYHELPLDNL